LVAIVLIATGALVIFQSFQIPVTRVGGWGPRAFPVLAAVGVVLAGLLVLIPALRGPAVPTAQESAPDADALPGAIWSVLGLIALGSAYIWSLDKIGYLLATALVAPAAFALFGVRRPLTLAIVAIICPIAYQIIFFELLRVYPPRGNWIDIVDQLRY
jgi:hypothetical protein